MQRTRSSKGASGIEARWWHALPDGRLQCDLCPRTCRLKDGQHGFCYGRQREGPELWSTTYGRASGFRIDPVEKKPLFHFLPGTPTLSFGTAGCNLGCCYCQNWHISNSLEVDEMASRVTPEAIARAATEYGCDSVSYTYNDPVAFAEFAIDTAQACHAVGVRNVAVTNGFVADRARADLFAPMDAANVDLKAFRDAFYQRHCRSGPRGLRPVLETLAWLVHESTVWVEITSLLIPGLNDSDPELRDECAWIRDELGRDVPVHFTAFHPDFRLIDTPSTPAATLQRARRIAHDSRIRHAYTGNIRDPDGQTTRCPGCGGLLVGRDDHAVVAYRLTARGRCPDCGRSLAGVFGAAPGTWGARRRHPVVVDVQ